MPRPSGFINVDDLIPQITVEQAAEFYGITLPDLHRIGEEVRCRCFLNCGCNEQTGNRALAIKANHPARQWKCHHYGCGKGGNLVSLCDLMKPGDNMAGRPRGQRFKEIAEDLRQMASGVTGGGHAPQPPPEKHIRPKDTTIARNIPLANSENERARELVNLDEKFISDPADMPPAAASYFRSRPYLTPEVCSAWRMGYLPRDAGGDRRGGTMRGRIVYGMLSDEGEMLTWFGRDPEFETKHSRWVAGGRQDNEPRKTNFVKGFHRGLELFGQFQFLDSATEEKLARTGVVVVEGPNDVIRLSELGQLAVGLCSNTVSQPQAAKIADLAEQFAGGHVTLCLDCDQEGENGARQALWELAEHGTSVRLLWSRTMHDGAYRDRQPESLSREEWEALTATL